MNQPQAKSRSIYQVGGSLPPDFPAYVRRDADEELYQLLKERKFCYVLNSRQMGKSSLRVRTMDRLQGAGISCCAIDLTEIGSSDITRDEWYAGIIDSLINDFSLHDFDLEQWWNYFKLLSPAQKLGKFFGDILLKQVNKPIVIFVDEIDSTLKLPFKDDFFALLRACYNLRADNEDYNRLTFCLLGVASPTDLIADKQSTPFNIGEQIYLKGFDRDEVKPLVKGLEGKVDEPDKVMDEILLWTGGQPFLTQRLCHLIVRQPISVNNLERLVQEEVIEQWESKDKQKHFSTIRDRILDNEQKASYLLELYRKVLKKQDVNLATPEITELQLTGLVVKKQDILDVYNPIYREIFNEGWIDTCLNKLRPYRESFRAWRDSEEQDESRLLSGHALREAEEWSKDKSISFQDRRFLEESFKKESKDKAIKESNEILEKANKDLEQANRKAKRRIRIGSIILGLALLGTAICGVWGFLEGQKVIEIKDDYEKILSFFATTDHLKELMTKIESQKLFDLASEIESQIEFADTIEDIKLKQVFLLASKSLAYSYLGESDKAQEAYQHSLDLKNTWFKPDHSGSALLVSLFLDSIRAQSLESQSLSPIPEKEKESIFKDIKIALDENKLSAYFFPKDFHDYAVQKNLITLEELLEKRQWEEANYKTFDIIRYQQRENALWEFKANPESCSTLSKINQHWVTYSQGKFGFSVQREIYQSLGGTSEYNSDVYSKFGDRVGWRNGGGWISYYSEVTFDQKAREGHLPIPVDREVPTYVGYTAIRLKNGWWAFDGAWGGDFFLRSVPCEL
jgi:hypothetical protein